MHASFGDILHTFIDIVTKILIMVNYLLFLFIFEILPSLYIICIHSLLVLKISNFTGKKWRKKIKEINTLGWGKISKSIKLHIYTHVWFRPKNCKRQWKNYFPTLLNLWDILKKMIFAVPLWIPRALHKDSKSVTLGYKSSTY